MYKLKLKEALRFLIFFSSMILNAFSVYLVILSSLGTHPIDALAVGFNKLAPISIGMWLNIISTVMILTGSLLERRCDWIDSLKTLGVSFFCGWLIDIWGEICFKNWLLLVLSRKTQILLFLIGIILYSFAIALHISIKYPVSALDRLMISIVKVTHRSLGFSRLLLEGTLTLLSLMVGGSIGIGTVAIVIVFPLLLDTIYKPVKRGIDKFLGQGAI
jgi:hypothetical protein